MKNIYLICRFAAIALAMLPLSGCKDSSPTKSQNEAPTRATENAAARDKAQVEAAHQVDVEQARVQREADAEARKRRVRNREQADSEEKARDERVKQEIAEREAIEQREELAKMANEEKAKLDALAATRIEQAKRREFAAEVFGEISLSPTFLFSAELRRAGASAEVKGEQIEKLRALFAVKDWPGVVFLLRNSQSTELPERELIKNAADDLLRSRIFPLSVKAPITGAGFLRTVNERTLHLVAFPTADGEGAVIAQAITKEHPDGNGYVANWRAGYGDCLLVTANGAQMREIEMQARGEFDRAEAAVKTKERLGEMTEKQGDAELANVRASIREKILTWAGVNVAENDPLIAAADAFKRKDFDAVAKHVTEATKSKPADIELAGISAQAAQLTAAIQKVREAATNKQKVEVEAARLRKQADEFKGAGFTASQWRAQASALEGDAETVAETATEQANKHAEKLRQLLARRTLL